MRRWVRALGPMLELVYPQLCTLCGAEPHLTLWYEKGIRVPGLRAWDETCLCQGCADSLATGQVTGNLDAGGPDQLAVTAAAVTNPDLVKLVGQFKYHGVRGLAWPLAGMLADPLVSIRGRWGPVDALVPVPLHSRRRRVRGFNQAEILARLVAKEGEIPVLMDVLVRQRNTGQQAKITSPQERRRNLEAAFQSCTPLRSTAETTPVPVRVVLVDDLVTSGCTAASAARSLKAAGWCVRGVLALGLAAEGKNRGPRVDTWGGGF